MRTKHVPRSLAALEDELPRLEGRDDLFHLVKGECGVDLVEENDRVGLVVRRVLDKAIRALEEAGSELAGETFVASVGEEEGEGRGEEEAEEDDEDGRGTRGESMGVLVAARGAGNFVRELAADAGVVALSAMGTRVFERLFLALPSSRFLSLLHLAPARAGPFLPGARRTRCARRRS